MVFTMSDRYINPKLNPLTKFTSSSRSTDFKDILPRNISKMITKSVPISTRIVKSYAMKQGILTLTENHWKLRKPHDQNFPMDKY